MLAPIRPDEWVQFFSLLTDEDFQRLANLMDGHPDAGLRVFGNWDGKINDLEFLRYFPNLKLFAADDLWELPTLEGLRHLPNDLQELTLGRTRRRLSISGLRRFRSLRLLNLEGMYRDLEVIGELTDLRNLTLRSITLPDLSTLLPLRELRSLDIKLGGTKDLSLLPAIGRLEYLELWRIRGLTDVSSIGDLPSLREVFLQTLKHVTQLPGMSRLRSLQTVTLFTMRGISDLRAVAQAPHLTGLYLYDMGHLEPESLLPLVGHPSLSGGFWGLGSDRKNRQARELLPLPQHGWGERPLRGHLAGTDTPG